MVKVLPIIQFLLIFSLGFASCYLVFSGNIIESPLSQFFEKTTAAPSESVGRGQIELYEDKVVIHVENAGLGRYAATGSMLPTLNEDTTGIRIVPKSEKEINVGDIVSFQSGNNLIIHRVIEKGNDSSGVYFVTKGDNADFSDGKIRFGDIRYKTIGLVY